MTDEPEDDPGMWVDADLPPRERLVSRMPPFQHFPVTGPDDRTVMVCTARVATGGRVLRRILAGTANEPRSRRPDLRWAACMPDQSGVLISANGSEPVVTGGHPASTAIRTFVGLLFPGPAGYASSAQLIEVAVSLRVADVYALPPAASNLSHRGLDGVASFRDERFGDVAASAGWPPPDPGLAQVWAALSRLSPAREDGDVL